MIKNTVIKILGFGGGQQRLTRFRKKGTLAVQKSVFYHGKRMSGAFTGSDHAKRYAKYRPTYPQEVTQEIVDYCKSSGSQFDLAVDIACGSGQSTVPLSKFFKKTIGVDVSKAQIENAPKTDNVEFRVGSGEDLDSFGSGTVDLITCAQGAHWLDRPKFFEAARTALKENGVLCFFGYGIAELDIKEASTLIFKYFTEDVGEFFEPGRELVNNLYNDIQLPFNDFHRVDKHKIVRSMPLDSLIGYASSVSAYQTLLKKEPDTQVLQKFQSRLEEIYCKAKGVPKEDIEVTVSWPIFMLLGRK